MPSNQRPLCAAAFLAVFLIAQPLAAADLPSCEEPALSLPEKIRCELWRLTGFMRAPDLDNLKRTTGPVILGPDRWFQVEADQDQLRSSWPDVVRITFFSGQPGQGRPTEAIRDHGLNGFTGDDPGDAYRRYINGEESKNLLSDLEPTLLPGLNQEYWDRLNLVLEALEKRSNVISPWVWQRLAAGLELGRATALRYIRLGDSSLTVLRFEPEFFSLVPKSHQEYEDKKLLDIEGWAARSPEAAALFNAGQYYPDKRYIGLLLKDGVDWGTGIHPVWKAMLLSGGPLGGPALPLTRILDMQFHPFTQADNPYRYALQSFMLLDANGFIRVRRTDSLASRTAVAQDDRGRMLVIFVSGACTLQELAQLLLRSDLGIKQALALDGGFQSQLYARNVPKDLVAYGAWVVSDRNQYYLPTFKLPIPAVIALVPLTR
ncbi:MAG: phosphodiester glycosidase family protein [Thermodesulfobacteriota bacterium]